MIHAPEIPATHQVADAPVIVLRPAGIHHLKTFTEHPVPLRRVQVDLMTNPAFIVDPDGFIACWNQAACDFFGREADETIGMRCTVVVGACTLDGDAMCRAGCPLLSGAVRHSSSDEVLIRSRDGRGRTVLAFLEHTPLLDAFGRPAGVLHVVMPTQLEPARAA